MLSNSRWKKLICLSLFMVGFIWIIFYSHFGLRILIKLTEKIIPGNLSIQIVHGKLFGDIHLQKIAYENKQTRLFINDLFLVWHTKLGFAPRLHIDEINVSNSTFTLLKTNSKSIQPKNTVSLSWFKYLNIQQAQITNLTINNSDKVFNISQASLAQKSADNYSLFIHSSFGNLDGKFDLKFSPILTWNFYLHGTEINPDYFYSNWNGKINIDLLSNGFWGGERSAIKSPRSTS